MTFRGKNAVVTGGAGGIGLQVARQLLTAGVAVSGAMRDVSSLILHSLALHSVWPS